MASSRFKFVVFRYVPNIVRDEAVNIGVFVREVSGDEYDFKFLPRSATVRKLWPDADTNLVKNFERQLKHSKRSGDDLPGIGNPKDEGFLENARSAFYGNLQMTRTRGILGEDIESALASIYDSYVAPKGQQYRPINYQAIAPHRLKSKVWAAFERKDLIRPDRVQQKIILEGRHAPWTFDLGYRNGGLKLINSVALNARTAETNLGRALVFKGMMGEVRDRQKGPVYGTAVVELPKKRPGDAAAYQAVQILDDSDVDVVEASNLGELVDAVAEDLGL